MTVTVQRDFDTDRGTFGRLSVDGVFLAYTLEPGEDETLHPPVPPGRYHVVITESPKFHKRVPLIEGIAGRSGIRVHPGNTEGDTDGCLLLGTARQGDTLANSRAACQVFQSKIAWPLVAGEVVPFVILAAPLPSEHAESRPT